MIAKTKDQLINSIGMVQILAAKALFVAMAHTELVRPVVEKYQKAILKMHQFKIDERYPRGGDVIVDPKYSYLMSDKDSKVYFAELEKAKTMAGFEVPKDYCPLLMAETVQTKAENALMDAFEPITGISKSSVYLERRTEYLDILKRIMATYMK